MATRSCSPVGSSIIRSSVMPYVASRAPSPLERLKLSGRSALAGGGLSCLVRRLQRLADRPLAPAPRSPRADPVGGRLRRDRSYADRDGFPGRLQDGPLLKGRATPDRRPPPARAQA